MLALALTVPVTAMSGGLQASAARGPASVRPAHAFDALRFQREHGYLPLKGIATLERAKAHAAAVVAARLYQVLGDRLNRTLQ